jgi:hypothetical protein
VAALDISAVVVAKGSRRTSPVGGKGEAAAEDRVPPAYTTGRRAQSSTPRGAARVISPPHHSAAPANDDRKSAIVTTTSKKRLKLLRADKRAAEPDNDPEATARVKAFFARMIRPGGALPPEKP